MDRDGDLAIPWERSYAGLGGVRRVERLREMVRGPGRSVVVVEGLAALRCELDVGRRIRTETGIWRSPGSDLMRVWEA